MASRPGLVPLFLCATTLRPQLVIVGPLLPLITVESYTLASDDVSGGDEDELDEFRFPAELLRVGDNVLAVELHQSSPFSSDLGFDLELFGDTRAALTRGPYLQRGTSTAVTVRWRTDAAMIGRVRYGPAPDRLDAFAEEAVDASDHAVVLAGLFDLARLNELLDLLAGFHQAQPVLTEAPQRRIARLVNGQRGAGHRLF